MGWSDDVYSKPEAHDLEVVIDHDYSDGYEFDLIVVFRDKNTGEYLMGEDSGCSCYSPFEGLDRRDLEPLNLDHIQSRGPEEFFHKVRRIVEGIDV